MKNGIKYILNQLLASILDNMGNVEIRTFSDNDEFHGYQEWYLNDELWLRVVYKHDEPKGYEEKHENKWSETCYYIK